MASRRDVRSDPFERIVAAGSLIHAYGRDRQYSTRGGYRGFSDAYDKDTPPLLVWYVKNVRALHRQLFVLAVTFLPVPWVRSGDRITFAEVAPKFWRAHARFGFMERPDIPALLGTSKLQRCEVDLSDLTYFVGHETVVHREDGKGLPAWQEALFAVMERNGSHISDYFSLPNEHVVEIGRQISI
jgi:KUP system potassium uptake protein